MTFAFNSTPCHEPKCGLRGAGSSRARADRGSDDEGPGTYRPEARIVRFVREAKLDMERSANCSRGASAVARLAEPFRALVVWWRNVVGIRHVGRSGRTRGASTASGRRPGQEERPDALDPPERPHHPGRQG